MNDIQVGDKVRFLANPNVDGYQYEPPDPSKKTDPSKHLKHLMAENLRDQFGTVIVTKTDDEVMVKLDDGRKVITEKQYLTKGA